MKRFLLPAFALALSLSAQAAEEGAPAPAVPSGPAISRVDKLSCRATNGVVIESQEGSPLVQTSWFGFKQTFQLMDKPILGGQNYVRIPLGAAGAPTTYLYDIFLWGRPEAGKANELDGVIGQTLYGTVIPPFVPSPAKLPMAFRPIAMVRCQLAGE